MRKMRRGGVAAVLAASMVLAFASSAHASYQWSDGLIQKSRITNCVSIIQGTPYQEDGAWTWTGQYLDPANFPDKGEIFYIHIVAGATGNSCSGQYVHFELLGPPVGNMYYDITPAHPVYCYAINFDNQTAAQEAAYPTGHCPQVPQTTGEFYGLGFDQQTGPSTSAPWPLPQGRGWEIQIPVYMDRSMSGGFGNCNDCNKFLTYLLDGNTSPQLFPTQGLYVDNATGSGGGSNPGSGGTAGAGAGFVKSPAPPPPVATAKKCKKGYKLKHGKCKKKKKKK
jgi:hypothetical protein